jgi:SAM-dependent methyltransferase
MISNTGAWHIDGNQFEREHHYDASLSNALCSLAKRLGIRKLYDFGCGAGKYVAAFQNIGINATGIDGNPVTSTIPNCQVQELTSSFQMDPVDFLLCLEVGEHIPKEFESTLLSRIDNHLNPHGTLVLSWAVKGQGGFGHVNCQNNDYVIKTITDCGYEFMEAQSNILRTAAYIPWFKNTILVFKKK